MFWKIRRENEMQIVDVTETIVNSLSSKLFDEWKHDGYCDGFTSDTAYMVVDGKRYCIKVKEMKEGEEFGKNKN